MYQENFNVHTAIQRQGRNISDLTHQIYEKVPEI